MIHRQIPGGKTYSFTRLLLDYNGTIARDGHLIPGVKEQIIALGKQLEITVVTADTFGTVSKELESLPVSLLILDQENQVEAKKKAVATLQVMGHEVIAIGNGRNDEGMVGKADLGLAILGEEGLHTKCLLAADLVFGSIQEALNLLLDEQALVATLRQ